MIQICQSKKYSLTPNKLFQPHQGSMQPAFAKTGYIGENNKAYLDNTKDHYEASTKVTPLADEKYNIIPKEKSLGTVTVVDDVRKKNLQWDQD